MSYLPFDVKADQKARQRHKVDSLNLLAYITLLILVLMSTWFFKRRRKLIIHETGLAIIFGMILGAMLWYFGIDITAINQDIKNFVLSDPPDYITVHARDLADKSNVEHLYAYEFRGELKSKLEISSQISYAAVDPEIFFNIILPPILLNAGLSLKRRHFFRNIGAIFSFAFLGTTISVASTGLFIYYSIALIDMLTNGGFSLAKEFSLANCFYFGAIISPTDPLAVLAIFQELGVDVNLFAIVFGESILNDVVSIVLTHSIDKFTISYSRDPTYSIPFIIWDCVYSFGIMFFTSCFIGIFYGIVTALMTKFSKLHESDLLETSMVVLTSYLAFLISEVIDASGIVTILICGITQAHYTINNLSFEARERLKNLFELLNFLCENFLFISVGVAFWQRDKSWSFPFIGLAFVAIILSRALNIYPLSFILNLGRRNKIPMNFQHTIAWGGAARGVISYALASRNVIGEARRIILSTTSVIVIFSVIVVGGSVEPLLDWLCIPIGNSGASNEGTDDDPKTRAISNPNWTLRHRRVPISEGSTIAGSQQNTPICGRHFASPATVTPVIDVERVGGPSKQCCRLRPNASALVDSIPSVSDCDLNGAISVDQGLDRMPILAASQTDRSSKDVERCGQQSSYLPSDHEDTSQAYEHASLVRRWRSLDNNFIKPILTNSQPTLLDTLPTWLSGFASLLTSEEQMMQRQMRRQGDGDEKQQVNQS